MTTRVELMGSLKELNCANVLSRRESWILLCDEPFHAYFAGTEIPRDRLRLLSEFLSTREALTGDHVYVICTNADEAPHASIIKGRGAQAIGLFSHVLPRLIALAAPRFNAAAAKPPAKNYALISLPRAASTVLAQELRALGVGLPTEHIRIPVIEFARHRAITNFDLFNWWRILTRSQTINEVFGTKIIWDFLQMFHVRLAAAEYDWLLEQFSKFNFFYLVRDDKVSQAVSDYVARATGVWHKWSEKAGRYEEKLKGISDSSTNLNELLGTYNKFCAGEDKLRHFLEKIGAPVTEIRFEQICEDPRREAAKIARALGFEISEVDAKRPRSLERTTSAHHLKVESELRAHLAKAGDKASTERKPSIMSSAPR
jgi:LPS sulfotransferase NodH